MQAGSHDHMNDPFGDDPTADDEDLDAVFTDAQMAMVQNNERAISEREAQINDIVKSIHGLAEVFKDLQNMVIDQGTVLDRIDYNIEQANVHLENAHGQLVQVRNDFELILSQTTSRRPTSILSPRLSLQQTYSTHLFLL